MSCETAAASARIDLSSHLPVLDGVRGLAILLVMQYHFYGLTFGIISRTPTLAVDRWASRVAGAGWSGVDLFFVLSGFLITGILYDAKSSSGYFRNFYVRRVLRIAPLYYAYLVAVLIVVPHLHSIAGPAQVDQLRANQGWYWTYLVNVARAFPRLGAEIGPASNHFWSLAVEEQFYLLWPLTVLVFSRRHLMLLCAVLIVVAFGIRVGLAEYATSSFVSVYAPHVLLPARMDTLAIGAFLALVARGSAEGLQRFTRFAPTIAGTALALLIALFLTRGGLSTVDAPVETIGFSAFAALYAALLVIVLTSPHGAMPNRIFSHPVLTFFGRYAYGLYVVHLLVAYEVAVRIDRTHIPPKILGSQIPSDIVISIGCTGVSVVLAWLSWHLFEKQVLKLKVYFPYERSRRTPPDRILDAPSPEPVA